MSINPKFFKACEYTLRAKWYNSEKMSRLSFNYEYINWVNKAYVVQLAVSLFVIESYTNLNALYSITNEIQDMNVCNYDYNLYDYM